MRLCMLITWWGRLSNDSSLPPVCSSDPAARREITGEGSHRTAAGLPCRNKSPKPRSPPKGTFLLCSPTLCARNLARTQWGLFALLWHLGLQQEGPEGLGDSTSEAKNHLDAFSNRVSGGWCRLPPRGPESGLGLLTGWRLLTSWKGRRAPKASVPRELRGSCMAFYDIASEVIWCHFHDNHRPAWGEHRAHLSTEVKSRSLCNKIVWTGRTQFGHLSEIQSATFTP